MTRLQRFDLAHKAPVSCYAGENGNSLRFFFSGKGEKTRSFTLVSKTKGEEGPPGRQSRSQGSLLPALRSEARRREPWGRGCLVAAWCFGHV